MTIDLDGSGDGAQRGPALPDSRPPASAVARDNGPAAHPSAPAWERPALGLLLLATAVTYLWQVDRIGWGNTYYSAAVQAGSQSWKAMLFGSLDAGNFITVDKPPFSLWPMVISARVFGLNTWSLLVPQVLMGVAAVWLLSRTVRRVWGPAAGLLAGLGLALTPAALLMFRYDNPDAALTLLLVGAGYALTRAVEAARLRWLVLCAVLFGAAFLTKELQGLIPLPAVVAAYLVCAPATLWTRVRHLLVALAVLVVSGGWWVALVELLPASARPYVGGSNTNSVVELLLGYNGFGRLTGNEAGGPTGGGQPGGPPGGLSGGSPFAGSPGLFRLANDQFAGMASWLLPTALIGALAGTWLLVRRPVQAGGPSRTALRRTDPRLAGLILWTGWTLATAAVFSFGSGVIHPYYAVALAPAVAALAAAAVPALWSSRRALSSRLVLVAMLGAAVVVAVLLLGRVPSWYPELRWILAGVGVLCALGILASGSSRVLRRAGLGTAIGAVSVAAVLTGSGSWALASLGRSQSGGDPSPGPAAAAATLPGGFGGGSGGFTLPAGVTLPPGFPGGGLAGGRGAGESTIDPALTAALQSVPSSVRWVAAASSSMTQGSLQLSSGRPVMALGGFSGGDPAITLDGFKSLVAKGEVRYYISGGGFGGRGGGAGGAGGAGGGPGGFGGGASNGIATWVSSTFTAQTVGGVTVYDLTKPKAP